MKTVLFSTKSYERPFFDEANREAGSPHELTFHEARLTETTTELAQDHPCVCPFVNDVLSEAVLEALHRGGTRLIALRSAGFNHVELDAAARLDLTVVRVPAYSPHAVAEHSVCLMLALNRGVHRAYNRVREGNFALGGLIGFDMADKTAGIVGTGKIGALTARILRGFGCRLLGFDVQPSEDCLAMGLQYVDFPELLAESHIITLHCPLNPDTHHLIDADAVGRMREGVMLINTSRGAVVDTPALIDGLKSRRIGKVGLDVYEEESDLFFRDLSNEVLEDDQLARLLTFPNVIITGHQAFLTGEALEGIADTTLDNISEFETQGTCTNEVHAAQHTQ